MARGRGRGRKLMIQSDFALVDGSKSKVAVDGESEMQEVEDRALEAEKSRGMGPLMENFSSDNASVIENSRSKNTLMSDQSEDVVGVDVMNDQNYGSKTWSSLFADNRIKEKGSELAFVSPSVSQG